MSNTYPYEPQHNPTPNEKQKIPVWAWITGGVLVALVIALIVTLSVGLSEKGDDEEPAPAPTVTVTEEPKPEREVGPTTQAAPTEAPISKEGFSNLARDAFPALEGKSDEMITGMAEDVCMSFDSGDTFIEVMEFVASEATSASEAEAYGGIAGLSVSMLCPQHMDKVEPYL